MSQGRQQAPVPGPSTWALFITGTLGLLGLGRRWRRSL
ncbi:MAG: PEP-CTERM sorting domain-containing protein [Candidatus Tectomicrobia bacterium]|uniref:PEP-CTERM sorting domain-containing protein n=1 Tax=Tectimicrobiota bacterium TaxID=2528274 RepID=A0A938B2F9_UNCTE|nr:PEP-CTERM sorting domain-containing protein [Candidatus Tectomicrobia bacterium]